MNCDCIDKATRELTEFYKNKGVDVTTVKIPTLIQMPKENGGAMDLVTYTEATIRTSGKSQTCTLNHSFCPFCGTKIGKEVNDGN
jgi:hypothetical protein